MTLKIERSYTNKEGTVIQLKYPRMKVAGKCLDENEKHQFIALGEIKEYKNEHMEFPVHTIFVKYPNDTEGFVLELSNQAYLSLNYFRPQKNDKLTVCRTTYTNKQTGAIYPIVEWQVEKVTPVVNKPVQRELEVKSDIVITANGNVTEYPLHKRNNPHLFEFVGKYKEKVPGDQQNLNHFIGTYLRTFLGDYTQEFEEVWNMNFVVGKDNNGSA